MKKAQQIDFPKTVVVNGRLTNVTSVDWDEETSTYVVTYKELTQKDYKDCKEISVNDLIELGHEEVYYNHYQCPKCLNDTLSSDDIFCKGCGVKIIQVPNTSL